MTNQENVPFVLIECPGPGDAEFARDFLGAALEADRKLQEYFEQDPTFRPSIDRLETVYSIAFAPTAMALIKKWFDGGMAAFVLNLYEEWGEMFAVMADFGFFELTGQRYQMTIPNDLDINKIVKALRRLAATEDAECYLHPEWLLNDNGSGRGCRNADEIECHGLDGAGWRTRWLVI